MTKDLPSPELLRKLLRYEPETGKLFWLPRPVAMFASEAYCKSWNTRYSGQEAFTASGAKGYLTGDIFDRKHYAHRVIWALVTGAWPKHQIDHENHNRADNKWLNLRDATNVQNGRNQSRAKNNTTGVTGVSFKKANGKYHARISVNNKRIDLGYFDSLEEAAAARARANADYNFHDNHGTPTPTAAELMARIQRQENKE